MHAYTCLLFLMCMHGCVLALILTVQYYDYILKFIYDQEMISIKVNLICTFTFHFYYF